MKKEHQIIMLPSDKQQENVLCVAHKQLFFSEGLVSPGGDIMPQHLYILSDEKFKEGDKLYSNGDIFEATKEMVDKIMPDGYVLGMYPKKIIATTDIELHYNKVVEEDMHMYKESLPHIPQHIIEAYVKKPFDEVEVEYEIKKGLTRITMTPYNKGIKPKLNQDGTLAVSLIREKMYSNESRKQLIRDFHQIVDDTWDEEDVEKWIKENL